MAQDVLDLGVLAKTLDFRSPIDVQLGQVFNELAGGVNPFGNIAESMLYDGMVGKGDLVEG